MAGKKALLTKLKELSILSLNGATFLGKVIEEGGSTKIVESIQAVSADFKENLKIWIKKDNLGELESTTLRGANFSLGEKDLTDEQIHIMTIVAAEAEYNMKRAVKNIENNSL